MKFIDLFSGIGGFRLALESLGHECVFSSEIHTLARTVYIKNFNDIPAGDITKIEAKIIPAHDIICAGFPCQPFSKAGKMEAFNREEGLLYKHIIRIAEYHKPKYILLENVKQLLHIEDGELLQNILREFRDIGYKYQWYQLLDSGNFGVPQHRERLFFILSTKLLPSGSAGLIKPPCQEICIKDILEENIEFKYQPKIKWCAEIKDSKCNLVLVGNMMHSIGQENRIYSTRGHAPTLTCRTSLYYEIDGKVRQLTERETARLQGFPDTFKVVDSCARLFGNSVTVPVVKTIAEKFLGR